MGHDEKNKKSVPDKVRLIPIGEFFSRIPKVWNYLEPCIRRRRRLFTFREILQKKVKKKHVCQISLDKYFLKKNTGKSGSLRNCAGTNAIFGKNDFSTSSLRVTLGYFVVGESRPH